MTLRAVSLLSRAASVALLLGACGSTSDDDGGDDTPAIDAAVASIDAAADDPDAAPDAAPGDPDAAPSLEPGIIDALPYLSQADSPFPLDRAGFYLEDFEDGLLDTPGVTADTAVFASSFGGTLIDSVDGDDGDTTNGTCAPGCDDLFGNGTITFTFDPRAEGGLPTHAGLVWTDGGFGADVTFEAFDGAGRSLGSTTAPALADGANTGESAEDRFFGVVAPGGVGSIRVSNPNGGTEADHLQYGR